MNIQDLCREVIKEGQWIDIGSAIGAPYYMWAIPARLQEKIKEIATGETIQSKDDEIKLSTKGQKSHLPTDKFCGLEQ